MGTNIQTLQTWTNATGEEDAMTDDHKDLWARMIRMTPEDECAGKSILDFGCSQGGFLRLLHKMRPYSNALGVDIAQAALETALLNLNGEPVEYVHAGFLDNYTGAFDTAFSHEVLYLLSDLRGHARQMRSVLKENGVYYAAIGCHTDNPLWPEWKKLIAGYSNVPVNSYSLDDYANAFFNEGFEVSARPFAMDDFVRLKQRNEYFPAVKNSLNYYTRDKVFFRFQKI